MKIDTLGDLFVHELQDVYSAELQLVDELDKLADEAHQPELKTMFIEHRRETEEQVHRVERAFESINQRPRKAKCAAIKGMTKEHKHFMKQLPSDEIVDMFDAEASMKVENYEITSYKQLIDLATKLGYVEARDLLKLNLREEEQALNKLAQFVEKYERQLIRLEVA